MSPKDIINYCLGIIRILELPSKVIPIPVPFHPSTTMFIKFLKPATIPPVNKVEIFTSQTLSKLMAVLQDSTSQVVHVRMLMTVATLSIPSTETVEPVLSSITSQTEESVFLLPWTSTVRAEPMRKTETVFLINVMELIRMETVLGASWQLRDQLERPVSWRHAQEDWFSTTTETVWVKLDQATNRFVDNGTRFQTTALVWVLT